jgi:hypothetical protein
MTTALTHPPTEPRAVAADHAHPSDPMLHDRTPLLLAALLALIAANGIQIAAGLARIDPSPPAAVLPMIAATLVFGLAAVPLVRAGHRAGLALGLVCCALSLVGMGPHKLFLEDGATIAPLALTGFAFEVVFARVAISALGERR